ncbi:MAG: ABC transporter permease [Candidatus Dormibacteria bacterium]
MSGGTFTAQPGGAGLWKMLRAQTAMETRLLLLNGEQLLLTIVIPTLVLVLFSTVKVVDVGTGPRVDYVLPGVLAIAVMSTAFTGQAIATGFERRYGVLKRLATSPLPRWGFIAAKTASVVLVEVVQVALLAAVGLALGWTPRGSLLDVLALLAAGTAAFSGLGLLMAGTLRAEATLAGANLVFLLLLVGGGVVVPLDKFPAPAAAVLRLVPAGALAGSLRDVIQRGSGLPAGALLVLGVWAAISIAAAGATFKWE